MRKQYDFSKAIPNPYASKLKKQITIRLDENVVEYFIQLAETFDLPYQNLINLYLRECAAEQKVPKVKWIGGGQAAGSDGATRRKANLV